MTKKRKALIVLAGFVALIGLAWLAGWGLHALWVRLQVPRPSPSITTTPSPTPQPPEASPVQTTETPTPPREIVQATSTAAPTATPTPKNDRITVRSGENLYAVCRRYCRGRFQEYTVEPDLDAYARSVAAHNALFWGWNGPVLQPNQELEMLPCPP